MFQVIEFLFLFLMTSTTVTAAQPTMSANVDGKPLILISAPSVRNSYYADRFLEIIRFDIIYAKSIMGRDNVIVVADKDTLPYLRGEKPEVAERLPDDILLEGNLGDIWIRDFGTVMPKEPVKFKYSPKYLQKRDSSYIDNSFLAFLRRYNVTIGDAPVTSQTGNRNELRVPYHPYLVIDGGNVVYAGDKAVLTQRVLEDNPTVPNIADRLKSILHVSQVALVTQDEYTADVTGHSDGILSFIDTNTLAISEMAEAMQSAVQRDLEAAFGNTVKYINIPSYFYEEFYKEFASACGVHVNSLVTNDYIYMPTFGDDPDSQLRGYTKQNDDIAFNLIQSNTRKRVIRVPVPHKVCILGGSVRCLSMQVEGPLADWLVTKARAA